MSETPENGYGAVLAGVLSLDEIADMPRRLDRNGYAQRLTPKGWRAEHRMVMAAALGRPLRPREAVHHLNGDRANNDPANLELWLRSHPSGVRASDITCPHCGK